jgi:hypothetical protein
VIAQWFNCSDTIYESGEVSIPLTDRVFGRYLADDVKNK